MHISDSEIHYLFGQASAAEIEPIFAALVQLEDGIGKRPRKAVMKKCLRAMLDQPQPASVEAFTRRLLEVDPSEASHALSIAIHYIFTATPHYQSALSHHKHKARRKPL